jgi:photosystem II stability/assembly factor-like uncharacterized protein
MADWLYLATNDGLSVCTREAGGEWREVRRALTGQHLTSVIAREGVVLAGSRAGVQRSDDQGQAWEPRNEGLSQPYVRWLAYHPEISDFELAGTEPAGLYISRDGGATWRGAPEVPRLRDQHGWFLPYSPEAGCVRGFAFHGQRIYAAVEVGGLLRSDDAGQTWQLVPGSDGNPDLDGPPEPFIYPDVHSIHVHPSSPDDLLAPTGGGFYTSADGGATWALRHDHYVRACWVDPDDRQHVLLGPAAAVGEHGRIEVSRDGGQTWALASDGLDVPWPRDMVERFIPVGDELLAVMDRGRLFVSPLRAWRWRPLLPEISHVNAAWFVPGD